MDSKYSVMGKSSSSIGNTIQNFLYKRKSANNGVGPSNGSNAKKIKLQSTTNGKNGQSMPVSTSMGTQLTLNSTTTSTTLNGINGIFKHHNQSSIMDQKKQLPVYNLKTQILRHLLTNETIIILSETGSGKSTQIPQLLFESGGCRQGMIAVTQPRRVAAITISTRVAKEMNCPLGDIVGYTVRFEDYTSKSTKIRFMTDGSLLREALTDRLLKNYSVIILDEAHERTINTDVLFGIIKEAQKSRKKNHQTPLKVIIMSATMDVDHFSNYFNNCKAIYLEGRTYPIKLMEAKKPQEDYLLASISTLFQIHETAPPNHDVLIFLTGQEEIEGAASQIRGISKSNLTKGPTLRVYPLYSQLTQNRQMEVFNASAPGTRKVIVSTNIAETSLTIPGIKYVIDSGVVKRRNYDPVTGMDMLKVVRISQDQAWQRCGRAGRESEGICYRTYTHDEYNAMPISTLPEILRSNITATVLQLLAIGIDCENFDFIDAPPSNAIQTALKQLEFLGAVKIGSTNELTALGRNMVKFPLDPKYSKILLSAPSFGCLEEMLSIVAVLSGEEIFVNCHTSENRADALTAHARFENKNGDHLTLLNVYKTYSKTDKVKVWCQENFLNARNLAYAMQVRKQLTEICERLELELSSCGNNFDQVRKCLLTGLAINIAELQRENNYLTLATRQRAKIHPSSILSGKPRAKWILFTELVSTGQRYMRTVTIIEPEWIEEVIPNHGQIKRLLNTSIVTNGANNNNNKNSNNSNGVNGQNGSNGKT